MLLRRTGGISESNLCWLVGFLFVFILSETCHGTPPHSQEAELAKRLKIYVLDVGDIAREIGLPECVVEDNVFLDEQSSLIQLTSFQNEGLKRFSHKLGPASGPWYLYRALQKSSGLLTEDIWQADIVYVYDYCYYSWWLAHVHTTGGNTKESPGSNLIKAWMKVTQSERWIQNKGRDYLFFHPHPDFARGVAAPMYLGMMCYEIYRSMHIVLDSAQFHECPNALEIRNLLAVPSVPHAVHRQTPSLLKSSQVLTYKERKSLVYFQGRCSMEGQDHLGWRLRRAVVDAFKGREAEIVAECVHGQYTPRPIERTDQLLASAETSVFCIIMRGGIESTRALNDAFLGGCIPVFVGPPFHTLPFASRIAYEEFAVFFELVDLPWVPKVWDWEGDLVRGRNLDESTKAHSIRQIHQPSQILDHLYGFLEKDIIWRSQEMLKYRQLFTYGASHDRHENAVSAIFEHLPLMLPGATQRGPDHMNGQNLTSIVDHGDFSSANAQQSLGLLRLRMDDAWQKLNSLFNGAASI